MNRLGADRQGSTKPPTKAEAGSVLMIAYIAQRDDLVRAFAGRLGSRDSAEDLVQDLGARVAELGDVDHLQTPGAYLFRLGWNLMLDNRRRDGRASRRDDDWSRETTTALAGDPVVDEPSPEAALDAKRQLQTLLAVLDTLPPKVRRAFVLHKLEGHSHSETARLMGISRSGVEKHMMAALRLLTARLG